MQQILSRRKGSKPAIGSQAYAVYFYFFLRPYLGYFQVMASLYTFKDHQHQNLCTS